MTNMQVMAIFMEVFAGMVFHTAAAMTEFWPVHFLGSLTWGVAGWMIGDARQRRSQAMN